MTESYWPKEGYLEPYKYQPEDQLVIKLNERFRLIEVSIAEFGDIREHLEFLDKKIKKLEDKK